MEARSSVDSLMLETAQAKMLLHTLQGEGPELTEKALGKYLPIKNDRNDQVAKLNKLIEKINKDLDELKPEDFITRKAEIRSLRNAAKELNNDLENITKESHEIISSIHLEIFDKKSAFQNNLEAHTNVVEFITVPFQKEVPEKIKEFENKLKENEIGVIRTGKEFDSFIILHKTKDGTKNYVVDVLEDKLVMYEQEKGVVVEGKVITPPKTTSKGSVDNFDAVLNKLNIPRKPEKPKAEPAKPLKEPVKAEKPESRVSARGRSATLAPSVSPHAPSRPRSPTEVKISEEFPKVPLEPIGERKGKVVEKHIQKEATEVEEIKNINEILAHQNNELIASGKKDDEKTTKAVSDFLESIQSKSPEERKRMLTHLNEDGMSVITLVTLAIDNDNIDLLGQLEKILTREEWNDILQAEDDFGYKPIHYAVTANIENPKRILTFLKKMGADPNEKTRGREEEGGVIFDVPLNLAKSEKAVQWLIDNGANVNLVIDDYDNTPLHLMAIEGNKEFISLLIQNGADVNAKAIDGHTPLYDAVETNNIESIQILLDNGADISISDKAERTPLHIAAEKYNRDLTSLLVTQKYASLLLTSRDKNNRNNPLHVACASNNMGFVKAVLKVCTPEQIKELLEQKDAYGRTPIQCAEESKNETMAMGLKNVQAKMEEKAGVETPFTAPVRTFEVKDIMTPNDKGQTLVHIACEQGDMDALGNYFEMCTPEQIKELLDVKDKNGMTPLHIAVLTGNKEGVEALIQYGANLQATAKNGYTPLHLAAEEKKNNLISCFINKGDKSEEARTKTKELLKCTGGEKQETPLHIAFRIGNYDFVRESISHLTGLDKQELFEIPDANNTDVYAYTDDPKLRMRLQQQGIIGIKRPEGHVRKTKSSGT